MRAVKARGLDKVFKNRDRRHRVHRQILRKNEGLILGQFFFWLKGPQIKFSH